MKADYSKDDLELVRVGPRFEKGAKIINEIRFEQEVLKWLYRKAREKSKTKDEIVNELVKRAMETE